MDSQKFLQNFSQSLGTLESELECEEDEVHSNIFVMGLPRSGSTLLTQILYNNTDLYCTNNLIARFWDTPLIGTQLSKLTIPKVALSEYESFYGRTLGIDQPHEFSRFWQQAIKLDDFDSYDPQTIAEDIDWLGIKSKILNMNKILGGGIVFKPMELVGFHLNSMADNFEKSLFVYIERDPIEVAISILRARESSESSQWWGSYPPVEIFKQLKNLNLIDQIAHQVCYFRSLYEKYFSDTNNLQLFRINYRELCESPNQVLGEIKKAISSKNGELSITPLKERLKVSLSKKDSEKRTRMQSALDLASRKYG